MRFQLSPHILEGFLVFLVFRINKVDAIRRTLLSFGLAFAILVFPLF